MTGEKPGARLVGIGVAACAACCAGPLIGFLAAAGVFTAAGVALFGAVGLLVLVPAAGWYLRRRQAAAACTARDESPVPVELGRRIVTQTKGAVAAGRRGSERL